MAITLMAFIKAVSVGILRPNSGITLDFHKDIHIPVRIIMQKNVGMLADMLMHHITAQPISI